MEAANATPEQFGLKVRSHPDTLIVTARNKMGSSERLVVSIGLANRFVETAILRRDTGALTVDIYSRKIVAWQVHERECAEYAAALATEACYVEGVAAQEVVLHADNGSPMKGTTMLATLERLGVIPSFSRPAVSDDNPFSESLFRTLKYRPAYPERAFENITHARAWVERFVHWCNHEHRHSAIRFVTPHQRHSGQERDILQRRHTLYQQARRHHPKRWIGETRNWTPAGTIYLTSYRPKVNKSESLKVKKAA